MSENLLRQILAEITELREDVSSIKLEMAEIKADFSSMKTEMTELKEEVLTLKSDVSDLKSDVSSMKSDVSVLKSDVSALKNDVTLLKAGQLKLEREMELIRVQLKETNDLASAIFDRQEETDAKLEALTMDVHKLKGDMTAVKETVADMNDKMVTKADLAYFDLKMAEHDRELYKLRQRYI